MIDLGRRMISRFGSSRHGYSWVGGRPLAYRQSTARNRKLVCGPPCCHILACHASTLIFCYQQLGNSCWVNRMWMCKSYRFCSCEKAAVSKMAACLCIMTTQNIYSSARLRMGLGPRGPHAQTSPRDLPSSSQYTPRGTRVPASFPPNHTGAPPRCTPFDFTPVCWVT